MSAILPLWPDELLWLVRFGTRKPTSNSKLLNISVFVPQISQSCPSSQSSGLPRSSRPYFSSVWREDATLLESSHYVLCASTIELNSRFIVFFSNFGNLSFGRLDSEYRWLLFHSSRTFRQNTFNFMFHWWGDLGHKKWYISL